jgi:hypothetical protein
MASLQVTCIRKRGGHMNPHERIQAIGGGGWEKSEDQAIREIHAGVNSFYVSRGGRSVAVVVSRHVGREYLKTEPDGVSPDNLLSLPDCA